MLRIVAIALASVFMMAQAHAAEDAADEAKAEETVAAAEQADDQGGETKMEEEEAAEEASE